MIRGYRLVRAVDRRDESVCDSSGTWLWLDTVFHIRVIKHLIQMRRHKSDTQVLHSKIMSSFLDTGFQSEGRTLCELCVSEQRHTSPQIKTAERSYCTVNKDCNDNDYTIIT